MVVPLPLHLGWFVQFSLQNCGLPLWELQHFFHWDCVSPQMKSSLEYNEDDSRDEAIEYDQCSHKNLEQWPLSEATFDGQQVGMFSQAPDGNDTYRYNSLVYSNASLEVGMHTFGLEAGLSGETSLVLFDYLIYT